MNGVVSTMYNNEMCGNQYLNIYTIFLNAQKAISNMWIMSNGKVLVMNAQSLEQFCFHVSVIKQYLQ